VLRMPENRTAMSLVTIVRDIGFVSFGKYGQYVVTAVTVPLTARILGIEGLGLLSIGMSSYFIGSLLVDLGITQFFAARMHHEDVGQLRGNYLAIRASIFGAIVVALLLVVMFHAEVHVQMILLGLFAGGFWSMSEDWVLIGQGRFGASTAYQGVGRIAYLLLLIVLLPRYPYAAVAMLCLAASSAVTVGLTWWDSLRRFGRPARPHGILSTVRLSVPMLTSRLLVSSYGQGSATVYSSVLDAASLGLFSAGDRMVRALQSLLDPIGLALLPRMAHIKDDARFWKRVTLALASCVGTALVVAVTLWLAAPLVIRVIYGEAFMAAVPLVRIEALILPATALTSFAITAVLPVRRDSAGVLIGAVIGTCVAAVWLYVAVHNHSVWALVYGTLSSEVTVATWYILRMWRLSKREHTAPPPDVMRGSVPEGENVP
jgi:O-antigen/teichoic acid export membrane protein